MWDENVKSATRKGERKALERSRCAVRVDDSITRRCVDQRSLANFYFPWASMTPPVLFTLHLYLDQAICKTKARHQQWPLLAVMHMARIKIALVGLSATPCPWWFLHSSSNFHLETKRSGRFSPLVDHERKQKFAWWDRRSWQRIFRFLTSWSFSASCENIFESHEWLIERLKSSSLAQQAMILLRLAWGENQLNLIWMKCQWTGYRK